MVKIHRAQDEEANRKSSGTRQESRSTLLGLAHKYAYLTNVSSDRVKDAIKQAGLSLGSTIEDDSSLISIAGANNFVKRTRGDTWCRFLQALWPRAAYDRVMRMSAKSRVIYTEANRQAIIGHMS